MNPRKQISRALVALVALATIVQGCDESGTSPTADVLGADTTLGDTGSGPGCSGPSSEACGNCGTRTRTCNNGTWSAWSACSGQGVCAPGATGSCGQGGTRTCSASCQWNPCGGQTCSGASSEACGNCGTRTRTCNNGTWSSWSSCSGQGVCAPGTTSSCNQGGTRTCSASCQWLACQPPNCSRTYIFTNVVPPIPATYSVPCGMVGQWFWPWFRVCDATTCVWIGSGEYAYKTVAVGQQATVVTQGAIIDIAPHCSLVTSTHVCTIGANAYACNPAPQKTHNLAPTTCGGDIYINLQ